MKKPEKGFNIEAIFKIHPKGRQGFYYTVRVFRNLKSARSFCSKHCYSKMRKNVVGIVHSYDRIDIDGKGKSHRTREIGDIHLVRGHIGSEIVAHECTHAAIFWLKKIKKSEILKIGDESEGNNVAGAEEALCLATGNLFRQCNIKLHDFGIWK